MSDPKQDLGPGNPFDDAPPRLGEPNDQTDAVKGERGKDGLIWSAPRTPHENVAHFPIRGHVLQSQKQPDIFAEALARAEQEQFDPELVEVPSFPRNRRSMVGRFAMVATGAAVVALVFVWAYPTSQGPGEDNAASALPTWESLKASLFPASARKPAPTLTVHDNSGYINEPLELGVSVDAPAPGMTVTIKWMPAGARLTAGRRASPNEWRVPAQIISDAAIIPPTDFVGELNLAAELHGTDGASLVTAFVRLTWASAQAGSTAVSAASTAAAPAAAPPPPVAPAPQQQQPQAAASPSPAAAPAVATPQAQAQAQAEPIRELSPNEIAALVRRAQELLASGDLQGARLLLTRAADAHDARAALLLAKTFDPTASRQFSAADAGPDVDQARNWYQRAREWGSPEAQRQLDALASFPRR
jgi:hypothetical protein